MMKDLKPIRGRRYIMECVAEGEHVRQDFKYVIPDVVKIARSISAFANNDGGQLLIGVKDNGVVAGVRGGDEDIYVVEQAARRYCEPPQDVEFTAFSVDSGVVVVRARIARAEHRPVSVRESDGELKTYYRVKDENIVAHPLMVRAWRQADSDDCGMVVDARSTSVLRVLSEGPSSVSRISTQTHLPTTVVEDVVAMLASMGVVTFVFDGTHFLIACSDSAE
jgi:hypothetical protein